MKNLILTGSYRPDVGGLAEMISGFAGGLIQHGVQVHILTSTLGAARFSTPEIPVTEFELPRHGYFRRVLACRRAVLELATQKQFDRTVTSSWSPFAVSLPARVNNRRLALDILAHGLDLLEPSASLRYRLLMRRTLRRAGNVLANSHYTAQLARAMGARNGDIIVMHPGVDCKIFGPGKPNPTLLARHQIPPDAPVLLSVGRLIERKGFDTVIRALPRVLDRHPSTVYLIVGDGPERGRLSDLANHVGVSAAVRFAGNIPMTERVAHYQLARIFVMPNRLIPERRDVEGFGIVFLEAACCELPTVGGDSGGVADAIEGGVTGSLVDPDSAEDCATKLISLLSDSELRLRMGRAGRERACKNFNWFHLTSRYLNAASTNE
ncbi:MAG TPA: glycosyltransferase family 4 protein [Acidobacteriota bacterium]|nr:glycosyltransferase family 4 protein [Acidobacteriota bacterium]